MTDHTTIDVAAFRAMFPMFASATKYPDAMIEMFYAVAGEYIPPYDVWCGLKGNTLTYALNLLTAHLLYEWRLQSTNQTGKVVTGATIDKVTVALLAPPVKNGWDFWLNQSPYGQQLLALLSVKSVGGWSVGGAPETSAFRRVGGYFR
jgi:hypothetical protein